MRIFLTVTIAGIIIFIGIAIWRLSTLLPVTAITVASPPTSTLWPTSTSTSVDVLLYAAWVSGVDNCPTSIEYGKLVVPGANLWNEPQMLSKAKALIPHGQRVSVYSAPDSDGMIKVQWSGLEGYVQSYLLLKYDPATGVQPDSASCF